jgi:hypothetical protein
MASNPAKEVDSFLSKVEEIGTDYVILQISLLFSVPNHIMNLFVSHLQYINRSLLCVPAGNRRKVLESSTTLS